MTRQKWFTRSIAASLALVMLPVADAFAEPNASKQNPAASTALSNTKFESVEKIAELLSDVKQGTDDEYRVISQVWRVSIDAGRKNQDDEVLAIIDYSTPKAGEPFRDWQSVVIGGGIINGISLSGVWPAERIEKLIGQNQPLRKNWDRMVELSIKMAHDEAVKPGTRYDALRILALLSLEKSQEHLVRYLPEGTNGELRQGAVSGLADIPEAGAAVLLHEALPTLPANLRGFAIGGLTRAHGDRSYLIEAVEAGKVAAESVIDEVKQPLLSHENPKIQAAAKKVFK